MKENKSSIFLIILYLSIGIFAYFKIKKYFNYSSYSHSILKNIWDSMTPNIIFSLWVSLTIGGIAIALIVLLDIFLKGNYFTFAVNILFFLFLSFFIFVIILLSLSITKDNAESFIAFLGLIWAMVKILPIVYKKIENMISS
ncbi:hypothetical protein ACMFKE_04820 [Staphylococcus haemolyticus]|uniref:hypothetical protein n=1 Tax=Staphylococcus haemolyticus TaxID=1283 RepID=UPI0039BD04FD